MVSLFYTTFIIVDLAHHKIFTAKAGNGIKKVNLKLSNLCYKFM